MFVSTICALSIDYSSKVQAAIELIATFGKFHATTTVIYFCINCCIISDQYEAIDNQLRKWSNCNLASIQELSKQLRCLQNHHALISRAVKLLNDSFGTILFLEILFIFVCFTSNFIRILMIFTISYKYPLHTKIMMTILIANLTANLVIICHSAERIYKKVRFVFANPNFKREINTRKSI